MDKHLYTVSEEEKYYFDLRGYLVVRNALTAQEVSECNAAIDHFSDQISAYPGTLARDSSALQGTTSRQQLSGMLGWPPPYREPFRRLLVHPTVVSRLNEFSGPGFRLDHGPLLISATEGTEGHYLHGAGEPFSPATWYHQQKRQNLLPGHHRGLATDRLQPRRRRLCRDPRQPQNLRADPARDPLPCRVRRIGRPTCHARRRRPLLRRDRHPRHPTVERQKSTALCALQIRFPGRSPSYGQILHSPSALRRLDRRTHARTTSRPLRAGRPPQRSAPARIRRPKNLDCGELTWMHANATSGT